MAEIVLGMATSHGPMLSTPWKKWGQRVNADRRNEAHSEQCAHGSSPYSLFGFNMK